MLDVCWAKHLYNHYYHLFHQSLEHEHFSLCLSHSLVNTLISSLHMDFLYLGLLSFMFPVIYFGCSSLISSTLDVAFRNLFNIFNCHYIIVNICLYLIHDTRILSSHFISRKVILISLSKSSSIKFLNRILGLAGCIDIIFFSSVNCGFLLMILLPGICIIIFLYLFRGLGVVQCLSKVCAFLDFLQRFVPNHYFLPA